MAQTLTSLGRVCSIAQGKGGVGKTTTTTNVGGLAAAAGVRTLIVDLDPQGNVSRDLGYEPTTGQDLFNAIITRSTPPLLKNIRLNLDVVPGGPELADLAGVALTRLQRGGTIAELLHGCLAHIAGEYDLILIDTPPGDRMLVDAAFSISSAVVIPTRSDEASIDGVERVAERFQHVRTANPDLELAGVLLFAVGSRSLSIERSVRATLHTIVGDAAPVFATRIRYLETAAVKARKAGVLVHELEENTLASQSDRFAALARGERPESGPSVSAIAGLASDFQDFTHELLERLAALETERMPA